MKIFFSVSAFLLLSFISYSQEIKDVIIYKSFLNAGTTGSINYAFENPKEYKNIFDTTRVNLDVKNDFNNLIRTAKKRKYKQRKIGGILCAGEFYVNNKRHFFIITNHLFMDFSDKVNYFFETKESINYANSIKKKIEI